MRFNLKNLVYNCVFYILFVRFYIVLKGENIYTYGKDEDNTLQIKNFTVRPDKTLITYRYKVLLIYLIYTC